MTRSKRLVLGVVGLAVLIGAVLLRPSSRRPTTPDRVVLIVIDTLRPDHLPFYGYSLDTAPFLSSLADRSLVFDNAHAASSWTAPSVASLMTSLYPFQHGVITGKGATGRLRERIGQVELNRIPDGAETIAEAMKARGYATFAVTENPNICREMGFAQGFDDFTNYANEKTADLITARLRELLPRIQAAPRYFLYLHYMDVHQPWERRAPLFDATLKGHARRVSAYDSEIHYVDEHIREAFAMYGWEQNALVIITADHGEELGERGDWGHGENLFAEVMNVPLLIRPPGGLDGQRRVVADVSHVDLLPTLRDLAEAPRGPSDEGVSLMPFLTEDADAGRRQPLYAHLYRDAGHHQRGRETVVEAAIEDRWKWIGGSEGSFLFELARDPEESVDRSLEKLEISRALEQRYRGFVKGSSKLPGATGTIQLDEESMERLKTLGYVD